MKIHSAHSANAIYRSQSAQQQKLPQGEQEGKKDSVEISNAAKQLQQSEVIDPARKEKVEQLKAQIENGTYEVRPEQTAKKMQDYWNNQ